MRAARPPGRCLLSPVPIRALLPDPLPNVPLLTHVRRTELRPWVTGATTPTRDRLPPGAPREKGDTRSYPVRAWLRAGNSPHTREERVLNPLLEKMKWKFEDSLGSG